MKRAYREINFRGDTLATIEKVNQIIATYRRQGYLLTLRQVYYQMVAAGHIPNNDKEYKRLGDILNNARYAGLVDWDAIEDRTRNMYRKAYWDDPAHAVEAIAQQYAIDKWQDQEFHVEVWVEKEALAGIVRQVARELDVNSMACKGYMSASEMRVAALRMLEADNSGKQLALIHLGDHDPSGVDMTRDIRDRLQEFITADFGNELEVVRAALNMDQIEALNPPPNPAKLTDSRCASYLREFGDESWELDAIPPNELADLIRQQVRLYRDDDKWDAMVERENTEQNRLIACSDHWSEVEALLHTRENTP